MDANVGTGLFGDSAALMLSVLIFLAVGTLAFAVMLGARARSAVRRRAQRVNLDEGAAAGGRSLRTSGVKAAQQLIDYATKHYSTADSKDVKLLRRRLTQAGIYDPRAPHISSLCGWCWRSVARWCRSSCCRCSPCKAKARSGCSSWWPACSAT